MDLETFVAETLRQIIKGVKAAQSSPDCVKAVINPVRSSLDSSSPSGIEESFVIENVEFDVAVTAIEGSEKKGGLTVWGIGGNLATNTSTSSVSRIKFRVPVLLPPDPKRP
jgi:hypothetical protein